MMENAKLMKNSSGFQRFLDFRVTIKGLRTRTTSLESNVALYIVKLKMSSLFKHVIPLLEQKDCYRNVHYSTAHSSENLEAQMFISK